MMKNILFIPQKKIIVSREFYDYIQDVLAIGYVEDFLQLN